MTLLEATPYLAKTGDRIWSLDTAPLQVVTPDAADTDARFKRLVEDYRLAFAYGIEAESEEGLMLASRLDAVAAISPEASIPDYWRDITRRLEDTHYVSRFFDAQEMALRHYVADTMRAYESSR